MTMKNISLPDSDVDFLAAQLRADVQVMESDLTGMAQRNAPTATQRDLVAKITRMKRIMNTLS